MKQFYYRIYYTIYRALIWFGQREETDMIRFNVTILMSLFTMFNAATLVALLIIVTNKIVIVNNTTHGLILVLSILLINLYMILYKNSYVEPENIFGPTWRKNKSKNIMITLGYIFFTFLFLGLLLYYLKQHPIKK